MRPPPPSSTLFPYTTLFRSDRARARRVRDERRSGRQGQSDGGRESGALKGRIGCCGAATVPSCDERQRRSEEHTSELQSLTNLVCRLLLEKKKDNPADPRLT